MNRRDRRAQAGAASGPPVSKDFALALATHQAGRLEQAEKSYEALLRKDPRHVGALHMLGVLRHQAGRYVDAAELIGRAAALRPEDPALQGDLGALLRLLGRPAEALAAYEAAGRLRPEAPESAFNLGNALADLGRSEEARAQYEEALRRRPAYVEALNNLGNLLLGLGDLAGAAQRLRQAAKLRPDLPEPLNNLGNLLIDLGDLPGAITQYRQALRFRPDYPDALRNLASALARQGKPADALIALERLLALDPADQRAALARATIFIDQGAADQALPILLALLDAAPSAFVKSAFARCMGRLESAPPSLAAPLTQALAEGWGSPRQLAVASIRVLKADPTVTSSLSRVEAAWPQRLPRDALLDPAGWESLIGNALLLILLETGVVGDVGLERLFTCLRAGFAEDAGARICPLRLAIARQCFINDYAYDVSAAEQAAVDSLSAQIEAAIVAGAAIPPGWIAVYAAYRPLMRLEGAASLLERADLAPVEALLRQQIREPLEERRLAAALPALTAVRDGVSQQVRQQYEESPYPRWVALGPPEPPIPLSVALRRRFPGGPYRAPEKDPPVLVGLVAGGGTGHHPIQTARRYAGLSLTVIDLSLASLGYAARKAAELGLDNIAFAQADILELSGMDERFDLIESVGVLHHLADPMAGWRRLVAALKPGGVMRIGLYSELARRGVVAGRALIAELGLAPTDRDIRAFRQRVMAAPEGDPIRGPMRLDDFYSLSECRDLLFHVQEHRFTIPQIAAALETLGLTFLGFEVEPAVEAAFHARHPGPGDRYDLACWAAFEEAHPDSFIGMYQFFAQKA